MKKFFAIFAITFLISFAACGGPDEEDPAITGNPGPDDPMYSSQMLIASCEDTRATWLAGMRVRCQATEDEPNPNEVTLALKQRDAGCRADTDPSMFRAFVVTRPPENMGELQAIPDGHQSALYATPGLGMLELYYGKNGPGRYPPDAPPLKLICSLR